MKHYGVFLAMALAGAATGCGHHGSSNEIKVAAAASVAPCFEELGTAFKAKTGTSVVVSPSASGKLAAQIIEGAPFDVFASADEGWVDKVLGEKKGDPKTKFIYAYGRLVVWSPDGAPTALSQLTDTKYTHIALAQPEHAPYGKAAVEAMEKAGIWAQLKPRAVYGSNVRHAYQMAETRNAEVAFTALSLVLNGKGHYYLVPDDQHKPLANAAVALNISKHPKEARAFLDFVKSDAGRKILRKHGLLQQGESL